MPSENEPVKPAEPAAPPPAPAAKAERLLLTKSGRLTSDGLELLEERLAHAAGMLGEGLAALVDSQVDIGQSARGALENAFEAARTALRKRPQVTDLKDAHAALTQMGVILANHTVRDALVLNRVRHMADRTKKAIDTLTP